MADAHAGGQEGHRGGAGEEAVAERCGRVRLPPAPGARHWGAGHIGAFGSVGGPPYPPAPPDAARDARRAEGVAGASSAGLPARAPMA